MKVIFMLQSRSTPYGKRITLLLIGFAALGIILCVAGNSNTLVGSFGAVFFVGVMVAALIMDWSGVITLCELIDWRRIHGQQKVWLILAWICFSPLFFCVYFVRVSMRQFGAQGAPIVQPPAPKRVKVGLVVGLLIVSVGLVSALSPATGATTTTTTSSVVTPTQTDSTPSSIAQDDSTDVPVVLPTDTPIPTAIPSPTPKPQINPTTLSQPTGINGNSWGYNFTPGNLIYIPPATFCDYFACIGNFWHGRGFVNECQDGEYSKSGGISGDCSHHGGELQPLYSH